MHGPSTNALQYCSGQTSFLSVQRCSAKQAHSMHFGSAITPMKSCCSCWCAWTQHQCTAVLLRANLISLCPALLCKTGSQHALCCCKYNCGEFFFIQVCSHPALMHCSIAQWGMHFAKTSAAVHWCWFITHQHEQQITIGVIALTECMLSACITEQHWTVGNAFLP